MEGDISEQSTTSGVPRGDPIYLPNMAGNLSTVPEFQSSFINLLEDLESHLSLESTPCSQQFNVSTDALKIYTEEELTDMAIKEAFREDNPTEDELKHGNPSAGSGCNIKRKRTEKKTEEAYVAKVEQLAKVKQKQDEDKASVRLHCFNKTCDNNKGVATSLEGLERMQSLRSIDNYTLVKPSEIQGPMDTLFPEVIMCVEIYNSRKLKVMKKAGQYDPSGYFFIEDIFHNDLRNPSATDCSKPILDWLWNSKDEALKKWEHILTGELQQKQKAFVGQAKSMDLPRFGVAEMQRTRFCDLRFRLGANYVYCHQGDCKHMMVIRDMKLIHPEDVHDRAAYPRLMFQLKPRILKCSVCKINRASKFAVDDKWGGENPCHFCDICFTLLHLEGDSLRCDFPVYDYVYE